MAEWHSGFIQTWWHLHDTVFGHELLSGLEIVEYIEMELLVMIKIMACAPLTVRDIWIFGIFKVKFMCLEYLEIIAYFEFAMGLRFIKNI